MPRERWFRITVIVGIAAGIGLRVWILRLPTGVLDGDEAIVGLMARHMLHQHEFTTFYWGQNYGGSLTAVVMAGVFAVFGSSTATLKYVGNISVLFRHGLPVALGLNVIERWIVPVVFPII